MRVSAPDSEGEKKKHPLRLIWASSFRRIQLTFVLWGVLLLVGGWLHNNYASSKLWSMDTMLWVWVGLNLVGLVGTYLLAGEFLASGMLFIWSLVTIIPFFFTWLILYPLNKGGAELVSPLWHVAFAIGYSLTAYYMDRRWWWVAGWEFLVGVIMLLITTKVVPAPDLMKNQGLLLGLTSGIPLLLAALPFWKERYSRT